MNIFDFEDYKKWVNTKIEALPKHGRGQFRKIAVHLNTSPTIITQVFKGERELTPEQALLLADYFTLSKLEIKFFILLVNYARAGTNLYKNNLLQEIGEMRTQSQEIKNRVQQNVQLTEEAKAILYSNWYFLAIWSLTAIKGFENLEAIVDRLDLNKKKAREALDFLLKYELVVQTDSGQYRVGPTLIHLASDSAQVARHHQNWRLQAFRKYESPKNLDTFYTAPVTLSEGDAKKIKDNLLQLISKSVDTIKDSPSEKLYCLCLDWFEV